MFFLLKKSRFAEVENQYKKKQTMVKYELEYTLKTTVKILFPRISTPSGLADWFADNVDMQGDKYTFYWNGSEQSAKVLFNRQDKAVRFKWEDDEEENIYFEFKIHTVELTGDVALLITEFADEDEVDDAKVLWDKQVGRLRANLGI